MNCVRWVHMNLISITFGDDDSTNGLMRMEAKRQTDIMVLRNFKLNHMTRNQRPFVIIMWWDGCVPFSRRPCNEYSEYRSIDVSER